MIVDIDIKQLKTHINQLETFIDECEEDELNIFNQLKESCMNWMDGNSIIFGEQMIIEKEQSQSFFGAVKRNKEAIDNIYEEYRAIGDKLCFNMDKENTIINAIDNCISKADKAISELNGVTRSFYYYERSLIDAQRRAIEALKDELTEFKDKMEKLYKRIKEVKERVMANIARLDLFASVDKFAFTFLTDGNGVTNSNTMEEALVEKNIEFLELYSEEEKKSMDKIFETFNNSFKVCKCSASDTLSKKIKALSDNLQALYSNRTGYINVLKEAKEKYQNTAKDTILTANKLVGEDNGIK